MKKTINALTGLFLALAAALALISPVHANEHIPADITTGSITVENPEKDTTYNLYKLFDLESYNADTGAYSYTLPAGSDWENFVLHGAGKDYISVNAQRYVTWKPGKNTETDYAAFARIALDYAKTNGITPSASQTTSAIAGEALKFERLPLGYYLLDTSLGSICSLSTAIPDATIREKNEKPDLDKKVQEKDNWTNMNDASVGDTVNFKITIHAKKGAENYVLSDTLSAGLSFDKDSVVVKAGEKTLKKRSGNPHSSWDYELAVNEQKFTITFNQTYLNTITKDTDITVEYSAVLNENAVIGGTGNMNSAVLNYGNGHTTQPCYTKTYTWKFDVFKYTNKDKPKTPLAGAEFSLCKDREGKQIIALMAKDTNIYRPAKANEQNSVNSFITDTTGKIALEGLDAGVYWLHEIKAPAGYNKLAAPIKVEIKSNPQTAEDLMTYHIIQDETALVEEEDHKGSGASYQVEVENKAGVILPSTGGMGTTIFYIAGSLLAGCAGLMMIFKKRTEA